MATLIVDKSKIWTADEYDRLDDDIRCQIINGELFISPAPKKNHQIVLKKLLRLLENYLNKNNIGEIYVSPADVYFDEKNIYQPYLFYLSKENLHLYEEKGVVGSPDLIIEILSPSNAYLDKYEKKNKYEEFGVKEYWIADPANRTLEIFTLKENKYILHLFVAEEGEVTSPIFELLQFDVKEIFE